jgi:alkaline phosphatase D
LRYALYKSDPDLQAAHANFPFIVTWDDHEVENNYAADHDQNGSPPAEFLIRRAAAYQVYYEHMPLRRTSMPKGPDMQLYRRLVFGDLAQFNVLDTRQYRSAIVPGPNRQLRGANSLDPSRVFMGGQQAQWLMAGMDKSTAHWNILAQQVILAQFGRLSEEGEKYSMDSWDGYPAERGRLMDFLATRKPRNPIVLSGDSHTNLVSDLKADFSKTRLRHRGRRVRRDFHHQRRSQCESAGRGRSRCGDAAAFEVVRRHQARLCELHGRAQPVAQRFHAGAEHCDCRLAG